MRQVVHDAAAEAIEAGHQAGADDCIVRPVRLHHLTSRLGVLAQKQAGAGLAHGGLEPAPRSGRVIPERRGRVGRVLELGPGV